MPSPRIHPILLFPITAPGFATCANAAANESNDHAGWKPPFNGKGLNGWNMEHEEFKE